MRRGSGQSPKDPALTKAVGALTGNKFQGDNMGVFSIIGLVVKILLNMPTLFKIGADLIKLITNLKKNSLVEDLEIVGEILRLIMSLVGSDKAKAAATFIELRDYLASPHLTGEKEGLAGLRDRIKKEMDSSVSHGSNPVGE